MAIPTSRASTSRGQALRATPDAMAGLLCALQAGKGLSASSRRLLLGLMTTSKTGTDRIKGLLPTGTVVAHKMGSSGTVNGLTRATNDVGLVLLPDGRHLVVVVFVSATKANEATRDAVIAKFRSVRQAYDAYKAKNGGRFDQEWNDLTSYVQYHPNELEELARRIETFRTKLRE